MMWGSYRGHATKSIGVMCFLLVGTFADIAVATDFDPRLLTPGMGAVVQREAAENARKQRDDPRKQRYEDARKEREGARAQREADKQRGCQTLKAWLDDGPLVIDTGRQTAADQNRAAMLLLEDGRFTRAFGKTYAQMTVEELTVLTRDVVSPCTLSNGPLGLTYAMLRGVAYRALSPERQAVNLQQLNAARDAAAQVSALVDELRSLAPTEEGYARLRAIQKAGSPTARSAGPAAAAAFSQALADAQARVAGPVQAAQVRDAVASAAGYEGMVRLTQLATDLRVGNNPGAPENLQRVDARINEIGAELGAVEHARIDVLGNGLTGLERGVQWQTEFAKRYQPYAAAVRPLQEVQSYFTFQRLKQLGAAGVELDQAARRATSDEQLIALQRRYLLAADAATVPGTQFLSTLADQRRELEKRSILGAGLDEERPQTAVAARGNANGRQAPPDQERARSASGGPGEPTEEEMYDLVRLRYENEAERVRNLSKRCNSSRMSDPGDAILCLSIGIAGGVGADQPMKITHFEKLGCSPASGKPGYYCEFDYSVSGGPTKFMGPITQSLAGDGGVGNARFLRRRDGWTMITTTRE